MKKLVCLFTILSVVLFSGIATAEVGNWMAADQLTIKWDPVLTLGDGSEFLPDSTISYEVLLAPEDKTDPVSVWAGGEITATISVPTQGSYLVGIKTILSVAGTRVNESVIGWSDDPAIVGTAGTFGVLFYLPPATVTGLTRD